MHSIAVYAKSIYDKISISRAIQSTYQAKAISQVINAMERVDLLMTRLYKSLICVTFFIAFCLLIMLHVVGSNAILYCLILLGAIYFVYSIYLLFV